MSGTIGTLVSRGFAILHELHTVYSLKDAFDMEEIAVVNSYNEWVAAEAARNGNGNR